MFSWARDEQPVEGSAESGSVSTDGSTIGGTSGAGGEPNGCGGEPMGEVDGGEDAASWKVRERRSSWEVMSCTERARGEAEPSRAVPPKS